MFEFTKFKSLWTLLKMSYSVFQNVLRGTATIGSEMAHQLYVLQCLLFSLLEVRRTTKVELNDQVIVNNFLGLCSSGGGSDLFSVLHVVTFSEFPVLWSSLFSECNKGSEWVEEDSIWLGIRVRDHWWKTTEQCEGLQKTRLPSEWLKFLISNGARCSLHPELLSCIQNCCETQSLSFVLWQNMYRCNTDKIYFHPIQNSINPVEDLCQTPPGILALDNMVYFAKMHGENYTKVRTTCRVCGMFGKNLWRKWTCVHCLHAQPTQQTFVCFRFVGGAGKFLSGRRTRLSVCASEYRTDEHAVWHSQRWRTAWVILKGYESEHALKWSVLICLYFLTTSEEHCQGTWHCLYLLDAVSGLLKLARFRAPKMNALVSFCWDLLFPHLFYDFSATDEGQVYYPMFFTNDRPFEEFYCIAIQLLNKTWKEMKATGEDFTKVSQGKATDL